MISQIFSASAATLCRSTPRLVSALSQSRGTMQGAIALTLALSGLIANSPSANAQLNAVNVGADAVRGSSAAERFFEQGRAQIEDEIQRLIRPPSLMPILQVEKNANQVEEIESLDDMRLRPEGPMLPEPEQPES